MSGKARLFLVMMLADLLLPAAVYANCAEFEQEADAIEGAVPNFNGDGTLRSISVYADSTFLASKRSLIGSARRKAELKAKRAFSEWMKENLESETLATDMMESKQVTAEGNTTGSVTELETQINVMRSNTAGVLSGLVKLDECVDTEQKFIIVQLGWKPSFSEAAADTRQKINSEVERGDSDSVASGGERSRNTSKITPSKGYRKKSRMKDDF